jgi:hypothetical protein
MNMIDTNTLDKKTKRTKGGEVPQQAIVEVIPNFITSLLVIMFLLNMVMGSLLYFNRGVIIEDWRQQVHNWTKPQTANAEKPKTEVKPTATPTSSPTVVIVNPNSKGACDTRYNELQGGVCYPKALE